MRRVIRAIGGRILIGIVLAVIGVIIALVLKRWSTVSNIMTVASLVCFAMLLFGAPSKGQVTRGGGRFGTSSGQQAGFGSYEERKANQRSGLRFGVNCILIGAPLLIVSIVMYFVHP